MVAALFVVLIGAGLIFGRLPMTGSASSSVRPPEEKYATAQFMRRLPDGNLCRFTVFDNKEGKAIDDRIARCDETRPQNLDRRPGQFSWGNK